MEFEDVLCICTQKVGCDREATSFDFLINQWRQYFRNRHIWKWRRIKVENCRIYDLFWEYDYCPYESKLEDYVEIIWHPVMIGDVYQWLFDNKMESNVVYVKNPIRWWKVEQYSSNKEFIFWRRENRRKPIENQSEECITFIYNLIIKHVPKKENSN